MNPNQRNGPVAPRIVLFQQDSDVHSELDLDLYDDDELRARSTQQQLSLSDLPSLSQEGPHRSTPGFVSSFQSVSEQEEERSSRQQRVLHVNTGLSSASYSSGSNARRRFNPHTRIRTDFTNQDIGTPTEDYEHIGTPPGDPPGSPPEAIVHPAYTKARRTEFYMRAEWVFGLIISGIGIGIAIESQKPDPQVAYWFVTIGDLYVRLTTCITFPLAFCQTLCSVAELTNLGKLRRVWVFTIAFILLCTVVSILLSAVVASLFQPYFVEQDVPDRISLIHPPFAFKCPNDKFMELQVDGTLQCTATNVTANATFPYLVDINQRFGLEEPVAIVDESGFLAALAIMYFPGNAMEVMTQGNYLSAMVVATVLGISIAKSYTTRPGGISRSHNPLFRLFTHIHASFFTMHEWVQSIALVATVPILIGAIIEIPNMDETFRMGMYHIIVLFTVVGMQSFIIVPIIYCVVVRENPFVWVWQMLAPIGYGMVFSHQFLPLGHATKAALRTKKISPALFGTVFPLLSMMQRSTLTIGYPTAVMAVAAYSGCHIGMSPTVYLNMVGLTFSLSFGGTMLAFHEMAVFLMMWHSFCSNEDVPPVAVILAGLGIINFRVTSMFSVMVNSMLVRMISHVCERGSFQIPHDSGHETSEERIARMERSSPARSSVKSTAI